MRSLQATISFLLLITACAPSEHAIQTAIAETRLANPTMTNTPTKTPTRIPASTPTLTPTPTSTPLPGTQTMQANAMDQTAVVVNATSTLVAKIDFMTRTAWAIGIYATKAAPYQEINWEELAFYVNSHISEKVKIRGKIIRVQSNTQIQINSGNSNAAVLMTSPFSDLNPGDWVTVYGTVRDRYCFNPVDLEFCYPLLVNAFYEK